jgi:hypothetical protein
MTMSIGVVEQEIRTINILKEIEIAAPIEVAFEAMLEEIGPGSQMADGRPFPMVVEPWPGGRWYRDLGDNSGHLWGHVQVIKPPALLELSGPMFMSFPGVNFVQYRLTAEGDGTRLKLTHQAMGLIPEEMRGRFGEGWDFRLKRIAGIAARRAADRRQEAGR